jgi:hypothetical protein
MGDRLAGRRVVVTCAMDFMGPAITEVFREEEAVVMPDTRDLRPVDAAAAFELGPYNVHINRIRRRSGFRFKSPKPFPGTARLAILFAIVTAPLARSSSSGCTPWGFGIDQLHRVRRGRTLMLSA